MLLEWTHSLTLSVFVSYHICSIKCSPLVTLPCSGRIADVAVGLLSLWFKLFPYCWNKDTFSATWELIDILCRQRCLLIDRHKMQRKSKDCILHVFELDNCHFQIMIQKCYCKISMWAVLTQVKSWTAWRGPPLIHLTLNAHRQCHTHDFRNREV